jgi:hypothetical protein
MDLHYRPDNPRNVRDGSRPSEIARQRPALATRIQGRESYHDMDADHTLRGGHFTTEERNEPMMPYEPSPRFVMDERDRCDLFNEQLRGGHRLVVNGDSE